MIMALPAPSPPASSVAAGGVAAAAAVAMPVALLLVVVLREALSPVSSIAAGGVTASVAWYFGKPLGVAAVDVAPFAEGVQEQQCVKRLCVPRV